MTGAEMFFLGGVIAAMVIFMAVLAWGEIQTRHLH